MGSPYLYAKGDPAKLLIGADGNDLPRNQEGIALVGDPRNDVHIFMGQMQLAFLQLHNRLVDRLRDDGVSDDEVFEEARRSATWHYQHVILREFLPAHSWTAETPLWLYILKEAEVLHGGNRLGRVGGTIVGEVLVGIINSDPEAMLSVEPDWMPTLPAHEPDAFGLADILVPAPG